MRIPRGFPQKSQCGSGRGRAAPEVGPYVRFPLPHSLQPRSHLLPQTRSVGLPWEGCLLSGHLPLAVQGCFGVGELGGQEGGDAKEHLGGPGWRRCGEGPAEGPWSVDGLAESGTPWGSLGSECHSQSPRYHLVPREHLHLCLLSPPAGG